MAAADASLQSVDSTTAVPSAAFAAHLSRFRRSPSTRSPTTSRTGASRASPALAQLTTPRKALEEDTKPDLSPSKPMRRSRSQSIAASPRSNSTPPRADGSSVHFKRDIEVDDTVLDNDTTPKKKKKKPSRPYAHPSQYAELGLDPIPDYIERGLDVLLCGINPGVKSAQMRQHYASPTNHFWKCLAGAAFTERLLHPSEGPTLPSRGVGSTNLVQRPSAEMSEISNEEMKERVPLLLAKVAEFRPRVLAFVGMKICEIVLRHLHNLPQPTDPSRPSKTRRKAMPKVKIGLQPALITYGAKKEGNGADDGQSPDRTYIWCLPSSSARVVEYQLVDKIEIWKDLKRDVDLLNAGREPLHADSLEFSLYPVESLFPTARTVKKETESPHFTISPVKVKDPVIDAGQHSAI